MSEGQQKDLALRDSPLPPSEEVLEAVAAKSGEELALFAKLAALLAGAEDLLVQQYEEIGKLMGTAGQLASDCHDLFQASSSKDLANGTRSYPLALYLEKKSESQRRHFLDRLKLAETEKSVQEEIRQLLHQEGILRLASFVVEVHCQTALGKLTKAAPLEPGASVMQRLIEHISFYHERR